MHEHTVQLTDWNKDHSRARQLTGCCVGSVAPRDLKNFAAFTRWSFRPLRKRPSRAASIVGAGTLSSAACCTVHLPAHSTVLVSCWPCCVNHPATLACTARSTNSLLGRSHCPPTPQALSAAGHTVEAMKAAMACIALHSQQQICRAST